MTYSIGLFYASTTGNTDEVAELIAAQMGPDRVQLIDVALDGIEAVADYQYLVFGIPTWDFGEIQEDWLELWKELKASDFAGKTCALFGLGDQIGYSEWFLDAMGLLHDLLQERGAQMVGYWPVEGYDFEDSKALTADRNQFVGLAIDEDCQHGETQERVQLWCQQVLQAFGMRQT